MNEILIRKATLSDVANMHRLINHYAERRVLLARPLSELYERVRDFFVLFINNGNNREDVPQDCGEGDGFCGVCGLGICWDDLAEIRSLAVWESCNRRGFGSMLVKKCLLEARQLGIKKIFTLTYVPAFFEKLGFKKVDKSSLPQKIWGDCLRCPQFPNCDEVALALELDSEPARCLTGDDLTPNQGRMTCSV